MSPLAMDGGKPVRSQMLPYGHQWVDEDDVQAVVQVLRGDWLTTGPTIGEFETAFAACVGARFAVAVANGTAALHAAAFAAGIGPGDEAITTPMTFAATANCVRYQGGTPVFVDVQPDTLNLDPKKIETAITSRTRAILPVDYAGQPVELDEINAIAARHGLTVIEDAAHALGATYGGKRVGALSTMTTFSLHPVKHITTGEGGIVTTDDEALAQKLRAFRNHGITSEARERQEKGSWFYEMIALGYNYRLTDLQCALGLSQLKKLDRWLARRRAIAGAYAKALGRLAEINLPTPSFDREPAWHLYPIQLNLARLRTGRAEIFRALRAENIGVNVHYIPVPWHPYYRDLGYHKGQWPVAEAAYERLISLPIFPAMTDQDVGDVIEAVHKVVEAFRA
ncbi:MAG: UDP-4-amino-4,6-dideoxy-N-acetyl-beta-L-altrosamine transaminase [Acidobacteriota bacterium]